MISKLRKRIELIGLVFTLLSVGFYTVFVFIMLSRDWGKSVYLYAIMGFLCSYIIVFAAIIAHRVWAGKRINTPIKDYKSGLKILKALLTLLGLTLSASVFSLSLFGDIGAAAFKITALLGSLLWAVFQVIYQIIRLVRRHNTGRPLTRRQRIHKRKNRLKSTRKR